MVVPPRVLLAALLAPATRKEEGESFSGVSAGAGSVGVPEPVMGFAAATSTSSAPMSTAAPCTRAAPSMSVVPSAAS